MAINNQKLLKVNTNNYKINTYALVILFAFAFMFTACIKDKQAEGGAPDRLFRPTVKGSLTAPGNYIQATWEKVTNASSYTVQLSKDTFKTIDRSVTIDTTSVLFENLLWDKLYQLQVRANASDSTKSSKMANLGSIKTAKFPSILKPFNSSSDATDEAVKVSWTTSGATVTSIRVLKLDSTLVKDVALTSTDVSAEYKIITGLASSASYIIELFSGTALRGYDTYKTKAPLAGNLIDLRNIEGRPSVLSDTLPLVASGSIVILKKGLTYTIPGGFNLSKAVTILSGDDLLNPTPANIIMSSSMNITGNSTIDSIAFNNVRLSCSDANNGFQNNYVFNISNPCTIGKIIFQSCKAEYLRGLTRLQTAVINVSSFIVNDCIIDSVRNYGVINVDNVNCKVNDISIRNSTIYKAEAIVVSKQNSNSVLIDRCTINEAPIAGNYLINYSTSGTNNVTAGIIVRNCIFGIGKNNTTGVKGIQAGASTVITGSNNYSTSDYVLAATNPLPVPGVTPYSGSSTSLWKDPVNGDFNFKDSNFQGKSTAGDPRWK
jgi:hypothetical protein